MTRYPLFGLKLAAERSGLGSQLLVASNEIHKMLDGAIFRLLTENPGPDRADQMQRRIIALPCEPVYLSLGGILAF